MLKAGDLYKLMLFLSALLLISIPAMAQDSSHQWSGRGLQIELAPLGGDQVRAFFIGREFRAGDANYIAETGCFFRSAIGNAGETADEPAITITLKKWRVIHDRKISTLKTRDDWAKDWLVRDVAETPQIAFHWALFPTEQTHQPTDYNWGMISFDLPPGSKFDLELYWTKAGEQQMHKLSNLECGK